MMHLRYIFRVLSFDRWLQRELGQITDREQKQLFMSSLIRLVRMKRRHVLQEHKP